MMSKKLETIINNAIKKANVLRHEYLSLETVLLSMLEDEQVTGVLKNCRVDINDVKIELEEFVNNPENFSTLSEEEIRDLSEKQFVDEELRRLAQSSGIQYQPEISLSLQRVIQRAAIHVQSSGKQQIKGINLLVALFQEKESFALYTLQKRGVERYDVVHQIAHGADEPVTQKPHNGERQAEVVGGEENANGSSSQSRYPALDEFTLDLNLMAEEEKIDPLVGREEEVERIVQILCRRRKNNPLLVGDAGVGKTAIAEGLAMRINRNEVPSVLEECRVFSLDMASLLAGAKFRGDFEQRLKNVLKDLEKMDEEGHKAILFIDEMHTVMGAGATGGGSMDASNLLKPALSRGRLRCLGSTTHEEYRKFIEKDPAFNRRFQKIDVDEPSLEDTFKILQGLRSKFEEHHGVKFSNPILRAAVDLSARFLTDRKNPDKAIDVIDEAGASIQLLPESKRRENITKKDVENVIAKLAKIPKISVVGTEKDKLKSLKESLQKKIYGQDQAIEAVTDAILMSRSGLRDEEKPVANFLFAGPTGVGKTELTKQVAEHLGCHFERFDMSEYMEKHTVAKLIGAPPGYVGYDQGGQLTDAVKQHPHCVLLLDEIEKAHPDLFNILLQVMDHGKLTDAQGRTTDFRNVVLIMTTNAGAKEMESGSIGLAGGATGDNSSKRDQALKNFFTPEFRNRLDAVVHFNRLGDSYLVKIVEKFLDELAEKLKRKKVTIEVTEAAKEEMARAGYDPKMGARPLARLIDQKIKKPLSQTVLFGDLSNGGKVLVDWDRDKKEFRFEYS